MVKYIGGSAVYSLILFSFIHKKKIWETCLILFINVSKSYLTTENLHPFIFPLE